jgi:uncharacterized protein
MDQVSAFFSAVRSGDAPAVGKLADSEPQLLKARDERGMSALLLACYMGQREIRDLLIKKGAPMELHEAAAAGQLASVREWVEQDRQAAKRYSPDGFPVLALAAAFGQEDVARYLVSQGADVNAVASNGTGYTALTGAVAGNHASIARWLAESGANVNYRYGKGHSPLLEAAANGNMEIAKMLVARGADLSAQTDDGRDAVRFAEERGHQELAAMLREAGKSQPRT